MWGLIRYLGLSNVDAFQALLTLIGILGASIAFLVGLQQYRTAQRWKLKEFVANEMKEFFQDRRVRNALLLIDWGSRNIELLPPSGVPDRVTRSIQILALRPHTVPREKVAFSSGDTKKNDFLPMEEQIRDTYDSLLDYLERFAGFLESKLVPVSELRPYLRYWVDEIVSMKASENDLLWTLCLLSYIEFYQFLGAASLFSKFGHDISVGGPIWQSLKARVAQKELPELLEKAVRTRGSQGYGEGLCQTAHNPGLAADGQDRR